MGYHLRVPKEGGFCYHADTLEEFKAFLALLGITLASSEMTTLACEQCGHLTTATKRLAP